MTQFTDQYPGGCFIAFNWSFDRPASAKLVEAAFNAHTAGFTRIHLLLSSTGGFLSDAYYATECLRALPCELFMYNIGAVQSAANVVFSSGTRRFAAPGATFYFHQTGFDGAAGERLSEKEIREKLRIIEEGDARSAAYVADRTGCTADTVMEWQREGRTLTAAEALAAGLIEGIAAPVIGPNSWVRQITL